MDEAKSQVVVREDSDRREKVAVFSVNVSLWLVEQEIPRVQGESRRRKLYKCSGIAIDIHRYAGYRGRSDMFLVVTNLEV